MIVAISVAAVALLLAATLVASGERLNRGTFRDGKWHKALQVAEAGIERTVVDLNTNFNSTGIATTSVPGGDFATTVGQGSRIGHKLVTSTGYVPSRGHRNEVKRKVTVEYGPPPALKYALYSSSCLEANNNATQLRGDIYATSHISLGSNTKLIGNVFSALGAIHLNSDADILSDGPRGGSVFSGGARDGSCWPGANPWKQPGKWGIIMDNGADISRDAHAQGDCSSSPPYGSYTIDGSFSQTSIGGNAYSLGDIGPKVLGTSLKTVCEPSGSRPVETLPPFNGVIPGTPPTLNSTLYLNAGFAAGDLHTYATAAAFNTYSALAANKTSLSGVHYINLASTDRDTVQVELQGRTIVGNFILITANEIVRTSANTSPLYSNSSSPNKTVQLISLRPSSPVSSGIDFTDNSFAVIPAPPNPNSPCMLFYSTGAVSIKNGGSVYGAVYGARLEIKNNFTVLYDPCVERSLGFGEHVAVPAVFKEVNPN